MSILGKEWQLNYKRQPGETLWSTLLAARTVENPGTFFAEAKVSDLHDPFLFKDMERATTRIQNAINARERIVVYGDYDVDGTSGTALLVHTLRFIGAEVSYRIPHRLKDGYGLHKKYIDELIEQNVAIVITVDLGISCPAEVAHAQENNLDVIITDHHTIPSKIPEAFAILHPNLAPDYPFKKLSGSGVAFKLACALLIKTENEDLIPRFIDLASLGTVADCVPLIGENRTIVKLGLKQLEKTHWDGLRAILERTGSYDKGAFTSDTIGFQIGPRLNASGRIDDPYWTLQTLLAEGQDAHEKSQKLEELNLKRRKMTEEILKEAEASIDLSKAIIIAAGKGWSSGIVGLIAGRLQEKYQKPAFIMEDRGDSLVGSARSLPGFHAVHALKITEHILVGFGGHEQAAGFHLKKENLEEFTTKLHEYAEAFMKKNIIKSPLKLDCVLNPEELTLADLDKISSFAPFGMANPKPLFLLENAKIISTRLVGKDQKHLKFTVKYGKELFPGIAFNFAEHEDALWKANNLVIELKKNHWKGETKLDLGLVDFS